MSCWLHMSRSVKGASGHTHGGEIRPVFGALLTSTLMRACALACLRACLCLRAPRSNCQAEEPLVFQATEYIPSPACAQRLKGRLSNHDDERCL